MTDPIPLAALMPEELINRARPVGAISHGISYIMEVQALCLDRDGGTWVKATATATPLKRPIRGYISIRREEDESLMLFGFDDPYLTFALSIFEPSAMRRKGYIPIDIIEPNLTHIGEYIPEGEEDEHHIQ